MTSHGEGHFGRVEVLAATAEQEPIVANLLELYAHDFSEFHPVELGPDGRFGYGNLSKYWRERDHHPFLLRVDGKLAGLVLVKKEADVSGREAAWDVVEFFVVRGLRRRGVGKLAAWEVWMRFPGRWQVRVMESNQAALKFWKGAIAEFAGETMASARVEKNGAVWHIFSFRSDGGPGSGALPSEG